MNQMYKCADACQNDMICVNQCFLTLSEKNELCPCGKFCESINFFFFLVLSHQLFLKYTLGGCPCLDCQNCWDCSVPTECASKDEEQKVKIKSRSGRAFLYFKFMVKFIK